MANYLNISNDNNLMVISDTINAMQPVLRLTATVDQFTQMSVDSQYGVRAPAPYVGESSQYVNAVSAKSGKARIAYRVVGNLSNLPYGYASVNKSNDATNLYKAFFTGHTNVPLQVQIVLLSFSPLSEPFGNSGLLAYNEKEELVFDASLGTVHYLGGVYDKIDVVSTQNKTYLIKDLTGLGLDYSRIFISAHSLPRVSFVEFRGGGSQYRSGWRAWSLRYRITDNKLYVDLLGWFPMNYTGYLDSVYNPIFAVSLYYLPNVKK